MKITCIATVALIITMLSGCTTTPSIPPDEALSFIQAQERLKTNHQKKQLPLYTQPVNKLIPCKLPTTQEQLNRRNFRSYWDGQCKNGYAYGLGRDIAISDTHHVEEITIYKEDGKLEMSPAVTYDFVHKKVSYSYREQKDTQSYFLEEINDQPGNFSINYSLGYIKNANSLYAMNWNPFSFRRTTFNKSNSVVYRYQETEELAVINDPNYPISIYDTLDSKTMKAVGYVIASSVAGVVRHFRLSEGGYETVKLPPEYLSLIMEKLKETKEMLRVASSNIERAKKMEREYLYLACNGKHKITGLDKGISNKICVWRNQFQDSFKIAKKEYNEKLEKFKEVARTQSEQRKIQEQLHYQKRMAQAAERQARAAERNNRISCYSNYGITTCY
ncbi:hypothetical protein [Kangiella spongicola]|uniref:Lipoprotein n=1 Tax=Kangiella spongicola TaxID=796379 RepID=A0A318D7M0_9GAMM|nr:hypothetical protein [Kangiella spongicola]PXF63194.1 hypothetical protein DL796_07040 [Kangiella spongicola]